MENTDFDAKVGRVADLILGSARIVVFTGAGVSTESGIPDFRSPGGIWSRFDPDDFTIYRFLESSETRRKTWELFGGSGVIADAEPNPAHRAIYELEKQTVWTVSSPRISTTCIRRRDVRRRRSLSSTGT